MAIVLGAFAAVNPFYRPDISPFIGYAAWVAVMALASACFVHPPLARPGVLLCGLFLAVPCFSRCQALVPRLADMSRRAAFARGRCAVARAVHHGFPVALYYLMSWFGTRELKRRPRSFHAAALLQFVAGTLAFAALVAAVQVIPASGLWLGCGGSPAG